MLTRGRRITIERSRVLTIDHHRMMNTVTTDRLNTTIINTIINRVLSAATATSISYRNVTKSIVIDCTNIINSIAILTINTCSSIVVILTSNTASIADAVRRTVLCSDVTHAVRQRRGIRHTSDSLTDTGRHVNHTDCRDDVDCGKS